MESLGLESWFSASSAASSSSAAATTTASSTTVSATAAEYAAANPAAVTAAKSATDYSLLTYFKYAATGFAFGSSISTALSERVSLKAQARQFELEAEQSRVNSLRRINEIQKSLNQSLATQAAFGGARGANVSSLSARSGMAASEDIATSMFGSVLDSTSNMNAAQLVRAQASGNLTKSLAGNLSLLAGAS